MLYKSEIKHVRQEFMKRYPSIKSATMLMLPLSPFHVPPKSCFHNHYFAKQQYPITSALIKVGRGGGVFPVLQFLGVGLETERLLVQVWLAAPLGIWTQ